LPTSLNQADTSFEELPVTQLKGVGPAVAAKLATLNIHTVQDVLFHLPLRYQDRTRITPIGALQDGHDVVIEGEVLGCDVTYGRRRSLVCQLQDGTGIVTLRFFHFSRAQQENLKHTNKIRCFGEVRRGRSGLELYHPQYTLLKQTESPPLSETLTPIYPSTEGLYQATWQRLSKQALTMLERLYLNEWLPLDNFPIAKMTLEAAVHYLHTPPVNASINQLANGQHPAQQRLAFEEMVAHHLSLLTLREQTRQHGAPSMQDQHALLADFQTVLPFPLTNAQQRVFHEIQADIEQQQPMLRLLQGDVGSGKTIVAALAALQAIDNGFQVALMAPTEILAEQHALSFAAWLNPLGVSCVTLTAKMKAKERNRALANINEGGSKLVIGTHALFQDAVTFNKLGLIIIDEQHRFGVHQRLALREKAAINGQQPHQLIMTATPIPRTLAMSAYADLDCSVIDELPPGRTPVSTLVISNKRRSRVLNRVHKACVDGRQAYWVCTLIEESEKLQCQAAEATAESLSRMLPDLRVGLVHGRMTGEQKASVMQSFKKGDLDLLVATTVIEVGVDVPNASLMIIENPERLGLAQLHQLRGRVGRGFTASHCVLMYQEPLSRPAKQRLSIMRRSNDGFVIAEQDLALRGPGEVLGTRQTGAINFRIADLERDGHLLDDVKACATRLLREYPLNVDPLIRRWLGKKADYGNV